MFKHTVLALTVALALGPVASVGAAGNGDNGPGCGLGKLAWMDYGGQKQIAPQVMMATTNGTFGSQTFGISSGTSGCTNDGIVMKNKHVNLMSASAFDSLVQEMAQRHGEHLTSLATLLGIPESDQPAFFALVQEKYTALVPSSRTTALDLLRAVQAAMAEHPLLARASLVKDYVYEEVK
jgi:hypothetical protein